MGALNPRRRAWLVLGLALLLAVGVYARSFDNGFRADDFPFLSAVAASPSPLALFAAQADIAFYRPLALALFALEYRLFGLTGGLYLAFNVLLQAAAAGLGLLLLRRLGLGPLAAGAAAVAFFAGVFHFGKEVTWACTSGGLLGLALLLGALLLAELPAEPARRRRPLARTAVLVAIALAAPFFHESGLLIGPLVLLRRLLAGRPVRRADWALGALLFLPALALWIWATGAAGMDTAQTTLTGGGLPVVLPRYLRYFGLALLPVQVAGLDPALATSGARLLSLAQLALGALVAAACSARLATRRAPAGQRFLAAWALTALLPYALIPVPRGWLELRYLHGAALPLAALAAAALAAARPGWRRWTAGALAAAFVVAALGIGVALERKYDREARSPENQARLAAIIAVRNLPR